MQDAIETKQALPNAISQIDEIQKQMGRRTPALYLDYDGTLTPIVDNPENAIIAAETKEIIKKLAEIIPVAIISGRDRADVQKKVDLENIIYAGSHGFDIVGPENLNMQFEGGVAAIPALDKAEKYLKVKLEAFNGAKVERKKYAIAVHFRNVDQKKISSLKDIVHGEIQKHPELKEGRGKKILELKPDVDWHKGSAISWLIEATGLKPEKYMPIFIGDDITDEDALKAVEGKGVGILVDAHGEETAATFQLNGTDEVNAFLNKLYHLLDGRREH